MRYLILVALLTMLSVHGHAQSNPVQGTDNAAEVAKIEQLYAEYRDAVDTGSIAGYLDVLHPEVRLLPPGAEAIDGAERYAGFLEPVFATATYRIEVVSLPSVTVVGDVAVAEYDYVVHLTLKDPDVGIREPGALTAQRTRSRYFDVLRKKEDGRWAVWRHTWSVVEIDAEDGAPAAVDQAADEG